MMVVKKSVIRVFEWRSIARSLARVLSSSVASFFLLLPKPEESPRVREAMGGDYKLVVLHLRRRVKYKI